EVSAIRKPPSAVAATPTGPNSLAAVAGPPSPVEPELVSVPATVVIVPPGETRRIAWLEVSAIRKPPSAVAATPSGKLSLAAVAGPPSPVEPDTVSVPATRVIVPAGETRRIAWLFASALRKPPSAVAATPSGRLRLAAVAGPLSPVEPDIVSVPATVKMLFVAARAGPTNPSAKRQHTNAQSAACAPSRRVRSVAHRTWSMGPPLVFCGKPVGESNDTATRLGQ